MHAPIAYPLDQTESVPFTAKRIRCANTPKRMIKIKTPPGQRAAINIQDFPHAEGFIENSLRAKIKYLPRQNRRIGIRANSYMSSDSAAWFCSYAMPITLQFPEESIYRIQFNCRGKGSTAIGQNEYAVLPDQAVITHSATQINFEDGFEQTVLRFSQASLEKKLVTLTGRALTGPLAFCHTVNPNDPKTSAFKRIFDFFMHEVSKPAIEVPDLVLCELEQALMASFLYSCPNNYSALLAMQSAGAAPSQVDLIEDYIESNWDKPINIEDLITISGCSARSIYRAFRQSRGYSPRMFVRRVRLGHAQEMLLTGHASTVTEVALMCGFSDLGRFSRRYQHMFGELPSHTLKHRDKGNGRK
ncbi:MAG: AraC family transcriptional regulator [Alphaproteobacteria bacterium]|nr:AraC family transcriptional regulator [Alphaproteobacteria bacterium]